MKNDRQRLCLQKMWEKKHIQKQRRNAGMQNMPAQRTGENMKTKIWLILSLLLTFATASATPLYDNLAAPASPAEWASPASYDFSADWTEDNANATNMSTYLNFDGTDYSGSSVTLNDLAVGSYDYYFWATNDLSETNQTQTYTLVVQDTTKPVITLTGSSDITIELGTAYNDAGSTANDNRDGDITANIVTVNPVDANTLGDYIVTYDVADVSSNNAIQVTRTVHVVDTTAPIISGFNFHDGTTYGVSVNWTTDVNASYTLFYGTNAANLDKNVSAVDFATTRDIVLADLGAGTEYYYQLIVTDENGNAANTTYGAYGFTTSLTPAPAPTSSGSSGGGGRGGSTRLRLISEGSLIPATTATTPEPEGIGSLGPTLCASNSECPEGLVCQNGECGEYVPPIPTPKPQTPGIPATQTKPTSAYLIAAVGIILLCCVVGIAWNQHNKKKDEKPKGGAAA